MSSHRHDIGGKPPKSDVLNRTSYMVEYTIDGVRYKEFRSLDVTPGNGNFFAPLGIKKVNENANIFQPVLTELDPDSEEGKRVLSSIIRANKLTEAAKDWSFNDDETFAAAMESGFIHHARGGKHPNGETASFINEKGVPYKPDEFLVAMQEAQVKPEQIFGADIFKNNEHLKYPIDMFIGAEEKDENERDKGSQDYIFIEQFLYKAPQPNIGEPKFADSRAGERDKKEYRKNLLGDTLLKGIGRSNNLGDPKGSCILPIPNRLGVSNGVNWGEGKANAVELGAFQAASGSIRDNMSKGGAGLVQMIADGYEQGKSVFNTISKQNNNADGNANARSIINAVVAKSVLGRIGINVDTEQFITRETGAAINPNLELLFGGPQLRTFSFVFNFAPNGTDEAKVVRQIQRWFRQGMLPQKTTNFGNGGSLFLGSPNVFRICYKNNKRRIKGLNTFKICALTSVELDFTPDSVYQSYEEIGDDGTKNSMPVRSSMKVTFNELTPIFANDYDDLEDPSVQDLGLNVRDDNAFTEDDLGF